MPIMNTDRMSHFVFFWNIGNIVEFAKNKRKNKPKSNFCSNCDHASLKKIQLGQISITPYINRQVFTLHLHCLFT